MKILIINTAYIGDVILTTPFIEKLKEKYHDSQIDFIGTPAGAAVLANNPNIDEMIAYDKKKHDKGIKGFISKLQIIRNKKYDKIFVLQRYFRSSLLAYLSGAKEIIGYREAAGSFLFTKKIRYDKSKHEIERICAIDNIEITDESRIKLYAGENEFKKVKGILSKYNYKNQRIIVMAPGSKWFTKMWPVENYNKLAEILCDKCNDLIIIITGGIEEKALMKSDGARIIDICGETSLIETSALMSIADILITNDSAPMHIASEFDTEIIALFGPTVKTFGYYPWSKQAVVKEVSGLSCRPCGSHGGKKCREGHFRCMKEISVEAVFDEAVKRINDKKP